MQLKIEINTASLTNENCVLCHRVFELELARVIACNDKNHEYGDVCPGCIRKGPGWVQRQLRKVQSFHADRGKLAKLA